MERMILVRSCLTKGELTSPFYLLLLLFSSFQPNQIKMNLTYIQQKVNKMEYKTLPQFFADVDLMISNALLYNSDPNNAYRIAAEDMKKRYMKIANKVVQIQQQQQQQIK
jgi:Bromodomain